MGWLIEGQNALLAAQVVVALMTAFATVALWRVTRELATETAALAKMTSRPFVVAVFESSGASSIAMNLGLRNTGNGTAFDVTLEISPSLPDITQSNIDNQSSTQHSVSLLPPGQTLELRGVLGSKVSDQSFAVKIGWSNSPGSGSRETLSYNMMVQDGFRAGWNTKGLHQVAEELEKIRKQLGSGK